MIFYTNNGGRYVQQSTCYGDFSMSTLFVNNLNTASGTTITLPTGKQLVELTGTIYYWTMAKSNVKFIQ